MWNFLKATYQCVLILLFINRINEYTSYIKLFKCTLWVPTLPLSPPPFFWGGGIDCWDNPHICKNILTWTIYLFMALNFALHLSLVSIVSIPRGILAKEWKWVMSCCWFNGSQFCLGKSFWIKELKFSFLKKSKIHSLVISKTNRQIIVL